MGSRGGRKELQDLFSGEACISGYNQHRSGQLCCLTPSEDWERSVSVLHRITPKIVARMTKSSLCSFLPANEGCVVPFSVRRTVTHLPQWGLRDSPEPSWRTGRQLSPCSYTCDGWQSHRQELRGGSYINIFLLNIPLSPNIWVSGSGFKPESCKDGSVSFLKLVNPPIILRNQLM